MAKGDVNRAIAIAASILNNGLEIRNAFLGTAAYAYYINMVREDERFKPMVVFDVDEGYVQKYAIWLPNKPDYAIMKMPGPEFSYIPIQVLGFLNLPGYSDYNGYIAFF